MVNYSGVPEWLEVLIGEKFFNSCLVHEFEKKNEENSFCLDCCISLCIHCLPSHETHRLLQIRRYIYQDVLRLKDAEKFMDCSSVQSYITNSEKVVFLKQRPVIARQLKGSRDFCIICHRNLHTSNYLFCSVFCKVEHMLKKLRKQKLHRCDNLVGVTLNSCSSTINCSATTEDEYVKGKCRGRSIDEGESKVIAVSPYWSSDLTFVLHNNRRKGVPHRSPFS